MAESFTYLTLSNIELEWLAPVSGAVNLLPVSQGKHVVALHLLASPGKGGPVSRLQSLAFHTHDVWLLVVLTMCWS